MKTFAPVSHDFLFKSAATTAFVVFMFLILCVSTKSTEARTIQLVATSTATGLNTAYVLSFNSLTSSQSTRLRQNDLIILVTGSALTSDVAFTPPTGYTELADLYSSDTGAGDANIAVNYAVATSGPNTGVTCPAAGASVGGGCFALIFRGVDPLRPIDGWGTGVGATGTNNEDVNCPAITPTTTLSIAVCVGGGAGTVFTSFTSWPLGFLGVASTSRNNGGTTGLIALFGAIATTTWDGPSVSSIDPSAFALNLGTASANSWAGVTLMLRPDQSRKIRVFSGITLKITSGRIILYQRSL